MVDAAGGGFEEPGLLGGGEAADVPDVGDWVAVGGGAGEGVFVVFVVEEEEFLVEGVIDPALVGEGGAFVGGARDDL